MYKLCIQKEHFTWEPKQICACSKQKCSNTWIPPLFSTELPWCAVVWYSWWLGCSKKIHTPPTEEITAIQGGGKESCKECLRLDLYGMSGEGEGGIVNFLYKVMDLFWNNPLLQLPKTYPCLQHTLPCICNIGNRTKSSFHKCKSKRGGMYTV